MNNWQCSCSSVCVTDGSEWLWNLNLAIQWKRLLDYIFVWLLLLWYRSDQLESDPPPPTHTHTHTHFSWVLLPLLVGMRPVHRASAVSVWSHITRSDSHITRSDRGAGTCVAQSPSTFCHQFCLPVESDERYSLTLEAGRPCHDKT